ncbi:PD-(D/E)XK nuclease family protein [Defluviitalea saccharophila]|uniref:PD-(D/E)XK nuclease family protein n=1 Tax=Defluviitalea saccharophila TaxID=879970 RepID=A0ABZ2Y0V1_9FIRM
MSDRTEYKNLKNSMETLDKIFKYLPEKDRKIKTIPRIFNRTYDENFISDFLAYVLDPLQNGVGIEPLIKVIEEYSERGINILHNLTLAEKNNISIMREYTFSNGRRIDILINIQDELIIGIENKIFSSELENQTKDYADSISSSFPDCEYVLLFLTPKGTPPESDDFSSMSYKQLIDQLRKVKFDYRDDIRRKIIFDEFILHVEEYMMNKKSESITDQTRLYLEYQETIEKLNQYFKKDSLMVFEEFEGIIRNIFEEEEWQFNIKQDRKWHTVYKKSWDIKGLFIHHEFWISNENILIRPVLYHMIEIEGRHREVFLTLFDKEYEKIKDEYINKNIIYRPEDRKMAIAYRILDNYFRPDYKEENRLAEEINKCKFIEEAIEKVYKEFLKTI